MLSLNVFLSLGWLETVSSTFQDLNFDASLKPLYRLMPKSWYEKYCSIIGELVAINLVAQ